MKKIYQDRKTGHGQWEITLNVFFDKYEKTFRRNTTHSVAIDRINEAKNGDSEFDAQELYDEYFGQLFEPEVSNWVANTDDLLKRAKQMSLKIIRAVAENTYKITTESECSCHIRWSLDDDHFQGRKLLQPDVDMDCCWIGFICRVDGEQVAQHIYGEGFEWLVPVYKNIDGFEDAEEKLMDEMDISDFSFDKGRVPQHEDKKREKLVEYLTELVSKGYKLYIDPERGFANEYTNVIVAPDADADEVGDDWYEEEPEKWADEFLYEGDDATQAFTSFTYVE